LQSPNNPAALNVYISESSFLRGVCDIDCAKY
jgi:hypothetical protein